MLLSFIGQLEHTHNLCNPGPTQATTPGNLTPILTILPSNSPWNWEAAANEAW